MPRGKGIYEDEPRDQLENAEAAQESGATDSANTNEATGESQEPPD